MPPKRKKDKGDCPDECIEVINFLLAKSDASAFSEPVDWELYGLTDYPEVIKKPMDLGTVRANFDKGVFSTIEEFTADVNLVWDNAMKYNRSDSEIYKTAEKFKKMFEKRMQKLKKVETPGKKGSSAKKTKTGEVSKADRIKFSQLVNQLNAEELEHLVEKIEKECPQALTEEEDDEIEISINNIDPTSLLSLNSFCTKCVNGRKKS